MHVGSLIERIAKERRMSQVEISNQLGKTASAIAHVYKRESVDTQLLMKFGEILEFDFFAAISKADSLSEDKPLTTPKDIVIEEPKTESRERFEIPIMVKLDGSANTLNMWISKLTAINQAV